MLWRRKSKVTPAPDLLAAEMSAPAAAAPSDAESGVVGERLTSSTTSFLRRLAENYYDFVDLGTCDGGGFEMAARQGGKRGLGFDLDPNVVTKSLQRGLDVACYDVCALEGEQPVVDFAICSHILEHLPGLADVRHVLSALSRMCRDYIFIFGPCFEEETYLEQKGVKILHSLMEDHTCKFKVIDLIDTLHSLRLRDYVIAFHERVTSTDNEWVHNAQQPIPAGGLWTFDAAKHLPKPSVVLEREVFINFVCVVPMRPGVNVDAILRSFPYGYDKIVQRSSWYFS